MIDAQAASNAAALLEEGGNLEIITGRAAMRSVIQKALEGVGFDNIQFERTIDNALRVTARLRRWLKCESCCSRCALMVTSSATGSRPYDGWTHPDVAVAESLWKSNEMLTVDAFRARGIDEALIRRIVLVEIGHSCCDFEGFLQSRTSLITQWCQLTELGRGRHVSWTNGP